MAQALAAQSGRCGRCGRCYRGLTEQPNWISPTGCSPSGHFLQHEKPRAEKWELLLLLSATCITIIRIFASVRPIESIYGRACEKDSENGR
jgi:hypothetical protein